MSEVKRYKATCLIGEAGDVVKHSLPVHVVYASNYDAAQSELAALREELASTKQVLDTTRDARDAEQYVNEELRVKLTAAEQRNSIMRDALAIAEERLLIAEYHLDKGQDDSIYFEPAILAVRAALAQPTESGASE